MHTLKTKTKKTLSFLALAAMALYSTLDGGFEQRQPNLAQPQPVLAASQFTEPELVQLAALQRHAPPVSLHGLLLH